MSDALKAWIGLFATSLYLCLGLESRSDKNVEPMMEEPSECRTILV